MNIRMLRSPIILLVFLLALFFRAVEVSAYNSNWDGDHTEGGCCGGAGGGDDDNGNGGNGGPGGGSGNGGDDNGSGENGNGSGGGSGNGGDDNGSGENGNGSGGGSGSGGDDNGSGENGNGSGGGSGNGGDDNGSGENGNGSGNGDSGNDGGGKDCNKACDVWAYTGQLVQSDIDLSLPGKGPKVRIERSWNSSDPINTLIGKGWGFNYGRRLIPVRSVDGTEDLVYRLSNGHEIKLIEAGDSYLPLSDITLGFVIKKSGTGWRMVEKSGMASEYNSSGKMTSIVNSIGDSTKFEYNAAGCLSKVTNASGNSLDIVLDAKGKIDTIADNFGRFVAYTHDSRGNLTDVNWWDGSHKEYTYNQDDLLTSYTNRRGQVVSEIKYYADEKVEYYTNKGDTLFFTYDSIDTETRLTTKRDKGDSTGRSWTYEVNSYGVRVKDINPMGHTVTRDPSFETQTKRMNWIDRGNGRVNYSYDSRGNMLTRTDEKGYTKTWTYTSDNRVESYTSAMGVKSDFEYNQYGKKVKRIDGKGTSLEREFNWIYNSENRVEAYLNSNDDTTKYLYPNEFRKVTISPLGDTTIKIYNNLMFLDTLIRRGVGDTVRAIWWYEQDSLGRRTATHYPDSTVVKKEYDLDGNLVLIVNRENDTTKNVYDAWNRKTMHINRVKDTTKFGYITIGDNSYLSWKSYLGEYKYFKYNDLGYKTKEIVKIGDTLDVVDGNDLVTSYTYYLNGKIDSVTSPFGDIVVLTYWENNKLKDIVSNGETTHHQYNKDGQVEFIDKPNGGRISYSYDSLGRAWKVSDSYGVLGEMEYDSEDNVVWAKGSGIGSITYSYNKENRVSRIVDETGTFAEKTYLSRGRVETILDSLGNTTKKGYDIMSRNTWSLDANGDTLHFGYDAKGRLETITDADTNTSTFYYNIFGRKDSIVYPDGSSEKFTYLKDGRLDTKTDARSVVTTFNYDEYKRISKRTYSDATPADSFEYDNSGRLYKAHSGATTLSMLYDDKGRVTSYSQSILGKQHDISYKYDDTKNLVTVTYPDGDTVTHKTDLRGRLDSIKMGSKLLADFEYTNGVLNKKNLGNGVTADYGYDAAGRLTSLSYGSGLPEFEFGYDVTGNKKHTTLNHLLSKSETYGYDATYQLNDYAKGTMNGSDSIEAPHETGEWELDSRGNWRTYTEDGVAQNREHNGANELNTISTQPITYDAAGSLESYGVNSYTWNGRGLMSGANGDVTYSYDALGRRVAKIVGGDTTVYVYNGWQVLYEVNSTLDSKKYVYGSYIDEPLVMIKESGGVEDTLYYLQGNNFNVAALTNEVGDVVEWYDVEPYGEFTTYSDNGNDGIWFTADDISGTVSSVGNEYVFQGRRFDEESGLYYFRNRYYSAELGRFVSRDPIRYRAGDFNLYRFVRNMSMDWVDPSGLAPGDKYLTENEAGYNALKDVNASSISSSREYGGWVVQNSDGTFSYTAPNIGSGAGVNPGPKPTNAVADYHTHGSNDPGYDNNNFSPQDTGSNPGGNQGENVNGFLATPDSSIKKYNLNDGKVYDWKTKCPL
jgi:RHS repeat-associated protein